LEGIEKRAPTILPDSSLNIGVAGGLIDSCGTENSISTTKCTTHTTESAGKFKNILIGFPIKKLFSLLKS
jgi:hypothetical protein